MRNYIKNKDNGYSFDKKKCNETKRNSYLTYICMVIYVYNVNKQEGENLVSCKNFVYVYIYNKICSNQINKQEIFPKFPHPSPFEKFLDPRPGFTKMCSDLSFAWGLSIRYECHQSFRRRHKNGETSRVCFKKGKSTAYADNLR